MEGVFKNNLSGFIGHTISQFILYSYEKLEDSRAIQQERNIDKHLDSKSDQLDLDEDESQSNTENGSGLSNSDVSSSNTESGILELDDNEHQLYIEVDKSEHLEVPNVDNNVNRIKNNSDFDYKYYDDYKRLQNMSLKNDIGYTRFISKIRLDEARSVIYGTWDAEQSESIWKEINGEEKETDIIFNDSQIIREEDLLKAEKRPEVILSTNHLLDYISYVTVCQSETSNMKFSHNKKYVIMFGGAQIKESHLNESHQNLFSIINGNTNFEFSNNLYFSEAQSFVANWELLTTVNPPEPRAFHASCIIYATLGSPVLVISGGFTYNKELVPNHLHFVNLSLHTLVWDVFKTQGPVPPGRYGHSISYVGSYVVMFGGTDGVDLFNDVWALNINYGMYEGPGNKSCNQWSLVEFSVMVPSPRAFHSCCKAGISSNSPMVIYGGLTQSEQARNRLYALHYINEKLIWSIVPSYTKCPSELRFFHTMTFLENMFIITGGDGYTNENVNNIKSMAYSMDGKVFQYIDDSIDLAGHSSWSAHGIIYHWGGVKYQNGKLTFDDSISVSNPLAYSDDRNIEEIYFKYIRYASINNMYTEVRDEADQVRVEEPEKVEMNIDFDETDIRLFDSGVTEDTHSEKSLTALNTPILSHQSETVEKVPPQTPTSTSESKLEGHGFIKTDTSSLHSAESKPLGESYHARPRRSAAIKCLTAIELDNMKHREQERLKENPEN
ncbi:hypothetical protein MACK_002855 [Theileria orientalis]|uniref:Kelch repeat containing protein n=1 Tax=Theileria orientalis TaxID=68886 RepID=A0A976QW23_THEOR|nr:hypothetical protein MACK_002855 [Theileria orientalis]